MEVDGVDMLVVVFIRIVDLGWSSIARIGWRLGALQFLEMCPNLLQL